MSLDTMSGADIDACFRAKGGFSLTNLEGTRIYYYAGGASPERLQVLASTPNLAALRNFLVTQARLGQ